VASTTLARSATTGAGQLSRAATGLALGSLAYAGWFRVGPAVGTYNTLAHLRSAADTTVSWVGHQGGVLYAYNGTAFASLGAVATGDWLYVAVSHSGTTATTTVTRNNGTTATTATQTLASGAVPAVFRLLGGGADGAVDQSAASVNLVRVWSAPLTAAEAAAEQASHGPVRTLGLWSAATLADTSTGLSDVSGNSRPWTATGTLPDGTSSLTAGVDNPHLSPEPPMSATAVAQATASGALTTSIPLAGAAVAQASAAGTLTTSISLAAAAQAQVTASGELTPTGFAAVALCRAAATGSLTTAITLAGAAVVSGRAPALWEDAATWVDADRWQDDQDARAELTTAIALAAAATSRATATAAINLYDYFPAQTVFKVPARAKPFAAPARYPTLRSPARST
jgi:hypothetical protein